MSEKIEKEILISIGIIRKDAEGQLDDLERKVRNLKNAAKEQKEAFDKSKQALNEYKEATAKNKAEQSELKTEMDKVRLSILQMNEANKRAKINVEAAAGSYDEAQKKLSALDRAIKSAQGGFDSSNPAVQQQIKAYGELNAKLKAFDLQMGNHQRQVGNYSLATNGLSGSIAQVTRELPALAVNFQTFALAISNNLPIVADNIQKTRVEVERLRAEGQQTPGVFKQIVSGLFSWQTAMSVGIALFTIFSGKIIEFLSNLFKTDKAISTAKDNLDNLNSVMKTANVEYGKQSTELRILYKAATDVNNSLEDRKKAVDELQRRWPDTFKYLNDEVILTGKARTAYDDLTKSLYENAKARSAVSKIDELSAKKLDAEFQTAKINSARNSQLKRAKPKFNVRGDLIYTKEQIEQQINQEADNAIKVQDRIKKGIDDQILFLTKFAGGANKLAETLISNTAKETTENLSDGLSEARQAVEQAEADRAASLARTLDFTLSEYGKELSATDQHYNDLLFKQNKFIIEQQNKADKAKSAETKALYLKAAERGRAVADALKTEWAVATESVIEKHQAKVFDEITASELELQKLATQNIKNTTDREVKALEVQREIQLRAAQNETNDRALQINRLLEQMERETDGKKQLLQQQVAQLEEIQRLADLKDIENAKATAEAIKKAKQKGHDELIAWQDQQNILRQTPGSRGAIEAQIQQIRNQTDKAIRDANAAGADPETGLMKDTSGIRADANRREKDMLMQEGLAKKQFAIDMATQTADATFNIFRNNIQRQAEFQLNSLARQKAAELQNTSLSSAQRAAIEQKYEKKTADVRRKAFIQQQKFDVLQAVINGALAITRAWTQPYVAPFVIPGIIATTAIQVAAIAAQKPPAYATGGLHYNSDGKGGYLRGPGSGTSDSMNARLSNGESIINAKSTSMFAPLLSAINQAGGGKAFGLPRGNASPWVTPAFATGGIYGSYTPTGDNGLRPSIINNFSNDVTRLHPEDIAAIAQSVAGVTLPPLDIKDVNYAQGKLARAYDNLAK